MTKSLSSEPLRGYLINIHCVSLIFSFHSEVQPQVAQAALNGTIKLRIMLDF